MAKITKRLKITGRVQGVGLRYSVCDQALQNKITGYVRNGSDGSVEAVLQGEAMGVDQMIAFIKKNPGQSDVEKVDVSEGTGDYQDFEIRY